MIDEHKVIEETGDGSLTTADGVNIEATNKKTAAGNWLAKSGGPKYTQNCGDDDAGADCRKKILKSNYGELQRLADTAKREQEAVQTAGVMAGMTLAIQGSQQAAQGALQLKQAHDLRANARRLREAQDNAGPAFKFESDPLSSKDAQAPKRGDTKITSGGSGRNLAATAEEDEIDNYDDGDLDFGNEVSNFDDRSLDEVGPGLVPGEIAPGSSNGGGGGLGNVGGGSTQASGASADGPQSEYANLGEDERQYSSGANAGAFKSAGGGARGSDRGGPDLAGLLAKFLPGAEEKDKKSENSILDFGGRSTASGYQPQGVLGRDSKSLFSRVGEVMARKVKSQDLN